MFKDSDRIVEFGPPVLCVRCIPCGRFGTMPLHKAVRRYGSDATAAVFAWRVAEDGGCDRVQDETCMAYLYPTPVSEWASLGCAQDRGWRAVLWCRRRHYALKRVESCPPTELDVRSLVAVHGRSCKLYRLERRAVCPQCGSSAADIEWIVPEEKAIENDSLGEVR